MQPPQQIKDLKLLLKDMEPHVRSGWALLRGRKFENFNQLPREAWGNWLLCAVLQSLHGTDITFAEDDGDGIILHRKTGEVIRTEHVSALDNPNAPSLPSGTDRLKWAISHKAERGLEYAEGKFLLVFFDGAGRWYRDQLRLAINGTHNFRAIYCIGLVTSGPTGYEYSLTEFNPLTPLTSISFKVKIDPTFTHWDVVRLVDTPNGVDEIALGSTN